MRDYNELLTVLRACTSKDVGCMKCPRLSTKSFANDCAMSAVRDAADAIEELVAAAPKWHPVSDPPKEPGRYICVVESQIWKGGYYAEVLTFSHGFFHDVGIRDDVAYWMPLPEPPKEVRDV